MTNARTAKSTREKAAQLRAEAERQAARKRTTVAGVLVVIVVGLIIGSVIGIRSLQQRANVEPANLSSGGYLFTAAAASPSASPSASNGATSGATPSGSATPSGTGVAGSAKTTVDIWEDFQCPACEKFETANAALLHSYATSGKINLYYHPVAILDRASTTQYSTRALNAWAAVVDTSPASAQAFHDLLFANQPEEGTPGLSDDELIDLAVQAGASRDAVSEPIKSSKFKNWTRKVTDEFSKKGFNGTPTLTVNGTKVDDLDSTALKAALDKAVG